MYTYTYIYIYQMEVKPKKHTNNILTRKYVECRESRFVCTGSRNYR